MLGRARAELRPCLCTAHKSQVGLDISSSLGGPRNPLWHCRKNVAWGGLFLQEPYREHPKLVLLPAFPQRGGCASAERVSRDQPAEVMKVQAGPEGGNCLGELRVMSEWDVEPFPQHQEKSYNLQKGRTDPSSSGRSLGS